MVACMVVMPRERWTDEKLDNAFGRIDGDLRELRVEMRKGFEKIDQRFEQMDRRFDEVDKRFEQVDKRFEQVPEVVQVREQLLRSRAQRGNRNRWVTELHAW